MNRAPSSTWPSTSSSPRRRGDRLGLRGESDGFIHLGCTDLAGLLDQQAGPDGGRVVSQCVEGGFDDLERCGIRHHERAGGTEVRERARRPHERSGVTVAAGSLGHLDEHRHPPRVATADECRAESRA